MQKGKANDADYIAKVIIVGNSGVGKTNILCRFCNNQFQPSYVSTIGVDFRNKTIEVQGSKLKLQIWDTAGQERFKNINQTYFKGAIAVVLTYSIIDRQSFESVNSWLKQINENSSSQIIGVLVGAKCDLTSERKVSVDEAKNVASQNQMEFFQVSAKQSTNIEELFRKLGEKIIKVLQKKPKPGNKDVDNRISLQKKDEVKKESCKC